MISNNKRGVSPIVATILIVGISIAAFVFIFAYTRGMIKEQTEKFGEPAENWCSKVVFEASVSESSPDTIYINNLASVPIYGFNAVINDQGKTTLKFLRSNDGLIESGESDSIIDSVFTQPEDITFSITPVLLGVGKSSGKPKIFPCNDKKVDLK
mgnify:CR=1 FL=1